MVRMAGHWGIYPAATLKEQMAILNIARHRYRRYRIFEWEQKQWLVMGTALSHLAWPLSPRLLNHYVGDEHVFANPSALRNEMLFAQPWHQPIVTGQRIQWSLLSRDFPVSRRRSLPRQAALLYSDRRVCQTPQHQALWTHDMFSGARAVLALPDQAREDFFRKMAFLACVEQLPLPLKTTFYFFHAVSQRAWSRAVILGVNLLSDHLTVSQQRVVLAYAMLGYILSSQPVQALLLWDHYGAHLYAHHVVGVDMRLVWGMAVAKGA